MHSIRNLFTFKCLVIFFWLGSFIAMLVYAKVAPHWWDFDVYWKAAQLSVTKISSQ